MLSRPKQGRQHVILEILEVAEADFTKLSIETATEETAAADGLSLANCDCGLWGRLFRRTPSRGLSRAIRCFINLEGILEVG